MQFSGTLKSGDERIAVGTIALRAGDAVRWWAKLPDDTRLSDNLQFADFNLAILDQSGAPKADTSNGQNYTVSPEPTDAPSDAPTDSASDVTGDGTVRYSDSPPLFFDFDHSTQWFNGNQALGGVWMTFVAPTASTFELQISLHLNGTDAGVPYTGAYSTQPAAGDEGTAGFAPGQWASAVRAQLPFLYAKSNFWPLNGFAFYDSASGGAGCAAASCAPPPPPPAPAPRNVGPEAHAGLARQAVGG